jgi:hypothetical protein
MWPGAQRTRPIGVTQKGKAACVATSGPSLGRKCPWEGSDSAGGYRILIAKTIAISGSIVRKGSRDDTKVYVPRYFKGDAAHHSVR